MAKTLADEARLEKDEPVIEIIRLAILSGENASVGDYQFRVFEGELFGQTSAKRFELLCKRHLATALGQKKREREQRLEVFAG